jgi:hypothetical protein
MSDVIKALLVITLVANSGASSTTQTGLAQNEVITAAQLPAGNPQDPILSNDHGVATQALDKAISERDEATIRLGLKEGSLSFKKDVVRAVRNAYFQSFVPDLIEALEENRDSAGAETAQQQELKIAVVSALMHLTGLRFPKTEELSKTDVEKILEVSREWYQENEPEIEQTLSAEMVERQQSRPILSKYYRVAKWAFDKAVLENDMATILLGLEGRSLLIRRNVVQALKQFDDKSVVPNLIKALDDNQGIMSGGSETQAEQRELNKEIISALRKLTGLEFSYLQEATTIPCFHECPSKDIQRILKESREWWERHR